MREVTEWFLRRLGHPVVPDEAYPSSLGLISANSQIEYAETDLIIIMSRKQNRLILNEPELASALGTAFKLEVKFLRNEEQTFEEQIAILRRARVVLAMHGSILVMAMFCRRGTVVIEMYPFAVPAQHYTPYRTMAGLTGMDLVYRAWENTHEDRNVPHPDRLKLYGGLAHLPQKERELVQNTKTVPQHICCTSPYWLYRIYQDTHVTPDEIIKLVEDGLKESRRVIEGLRDRRNPTLIPPPVNLLNCIDHPTRPNGTLWVKWYW